MLAMLAAILGMAVWEKMESEEMLTLGVHVSRMWNNPECRPLYRPVWRESSRKFAVGDQGVEFRTKADQHFVERKRTERHAAAFKIDEIRAAP